MKKILKISGIVILVLLLIIIVVPFLFKNQIKAKVEEEINMNLNARVHFESLNLSLIKSFPDFYLSLNGLTVIGKDDFEKDTLLSFKSFSAKLDLVSVIHMKDIKVKAIILDCPKIYALVLKDGKANWDITKPSIDTSKKTDTTKAVSSTKTADTAKSQPSAFKVSLKKFAIQNANIVYDDQKSGMSATLKNFNFELSGNLGSDYTTINILTSTDAINFKMGGISYLKNARNKVILAIDADLKNMVYTLKENEFTLNNIVLSWNGKVSMKDSIISTDITFGTKRTDFKSLLSMVPAIFMKDFESLKTQGILKLDGYVKGIYCGKKMPNVGIRLLVENAYLKYPSLPKSVDNINIDIKVFWDGINNDNSTIDINKFHIEIVKNPIDITFNLKTPISDPAIEGKFKGKIDLGSIADAIPLDSTSLIGNIEANVDFKGKMSMIQKQKYEDFKADGFLNLSGFNFKNPSLKQGAYIEKANLLFSPKFVELIAFDAQIGKTDIHLKGKLTNFIPFALKGETIHGNLDLTSRLIDLNEFMGGPAKPDTTKKANATALADTAKKADTTQLSTVEVPKNIDFTLTTKLSKLIYDKIDITNISGIIKVNDGKVSLDKLFMNLLEGSMTMTGEYNTQDMKKPFTNFNLDIKDFDIPSTFKAFNTVKKMAPIAENAKGKVSIALTLKTLIDTHMAPILKTMNGEGKLASKQIEIQNSKTFAKIADAIKDDNLKDLKANDVNFTFHIRDGRIYIDPFDTKIAGKKVNISGDQGLDQTMNYKMKIHVPGSNLSGITDQLFGSAVSKGLTSAIGDIIVNVNIKGTFNDPKVGVSFGGDESKGGAKEQPKEQIKQAIKEQANLEIAKQQADATRASAKQSADLVRKQSNDQADRIVNEASNPFAKVAAKKLAEKIRSEGEKKAQKIESDGNQKADEILKKAQADSDNKK